MKGFAVWLLPMLASLSCLSQDLTNFTQFFINPYTLNPSYAGVEGRTAVFAGYRKQWTSIEGGPTIANFSLHTPLKKQLSFGTNLISDKRGIVSTSALLATVGYALPIDHETFVRFGLSVGYGYNNVDLSNVGAINDPVVASLATKNTNATLLGNAGVSFHKKTFHGGIAMPNIFQPIYLSKDAFSITALKPFQSVVIHASNRFYFNKDQNVFEPYLIYRLNNSLPSQLEAAAILHLQHVIWVGASYKQQFGLSGLFGFKIQNQFAIGFSYSIKNGGENQIPSPSYEIQLGYLAGAKKKDVNAYSFVNTKKEKVHRKTATEIAAEKKKQQQLQAKKAEDDKKKKEEQLAKQQMEQQKAKEAIALKTVAPKAEQKTVIPDVKKDSVVHSHSPRYKRSTVPTTNEVQKVTDPQHHEEQDKLKRLEEHADNPTEEHNNEVEHPHAERHEFVKRGEHHEELDYGDYVIAGVFKNKPNAEHFSKGLNNMSFTSDFGYLTAKDLWYVYITATDDIDEAKKERDKYRKLKIFRDAWLLTVHK